MTIEKTIEIPIDRRFHLDFVLPQSLPVGKAKVAVIVTPVPAAIGVHETGDSLCGAAKDSKLTLARFMEMQGEDIDLENAIDKRQWGVQ
jgi:hypothetical protein